MMLDQPTHDLGSMTAWATAQPLIRAMLLTSTRAIPDAPVDVLSDFDIVLIVQDLDPFVADRAWINDFGAVLVVYWDQVSADPVFGINCCGNVTQYADGLKIDFTLWPVALFEQIVAAPALPDELDAGYLVLLDKDQLTANMRPPTATAYVPARPTDAEYQTLINDFLSDPPYVAKCLWRDELLPAKWCLDYDMKHVYLRQLLEWRVEIDHGWSVPVGSLGKGLKKRLPAQLWLEVEQTFTGARIADNWESLANTMALFRQVAVEVGAQLGYAYPHDVHARVAAYVEQIKQLKSPASLNENTLSNPHPTPYADVNAVLQTLLERVQAILGSHFIGMYLDGSLTNDAFDHASDIDFIVVTDAEVESDHFLALHAMHAQLAMSNARWGTELEGSYISQKALRRYDPAQTVHPNIERGPNERLKMLHHDAAWLIHRAIVRERGITLAGPAPHTLIDPVTPAEVRQALRSMLPGWVMSVLQHPAQLEHRGYQSYVVLTLCRVRYSLHTGAVASKLAAAGWAQDALGARWQALIERAVIGRHDSDSEVLAADFNGTLDLLHDTLDFSQRYELPPEQP